MKFYYILTYIFLLVISSAGQTTEILNRFRLAQSYEQAGDLKKAESIYQELYTKQPLNFQFFDALNRLYIQQKQYDKSIFIIEERIKQSPMDINLYGLLGSAHYLKGDEDEAFEVWDKSLKDLPVSQVNYRVIANYAIERRAFNKAIEVLTKGKTVLQEQSNFSFDLAHLYATLMKYSEAAEEFCAVLANDPNQLNLVQSRMSGYIIKPEAFQPTVNVVEKWADNTENVNFFHLLGWLYTEQNNYDKALEVYLKIDSRKDNNGADLFSFSQRAYQEKQFNAASQGFRRIIDQYPNSPFAGNARIGFAKTSEALIDGENSLNSEWKPFSAGNTADPDKYADVINAYDELTRIYPRSEIENEANYRKGLIYLDKMNNLQAAEESFNKIIEKAPVSLFIVSVLKQLSKLKIIQNELGKAGEYLSQIISNSRSTPEEKNEAEFFKGKIEFWNGNYAAAVERLARITKTLGDNTANDAIELSIIINTSKQDSANLVKFAFAELLAEQRKFTEAYQIYGELSENKNLLSLKDLSALRKCEMTIAMDKLPEAISSLQELLSEENQNIYADKSLFLIGQIYQFGINDKPAAVKAYENLLEKFPNSLYLDSARENITLLKNGMSNNL